MPVVVALNISESRHAENHTIVSEVHHTPLRDSPSAMHAGDFWQGGDLNLGGKREKKKIYMYKWIKRKAARNKTQSEKAFWGSTDHVANEVHRAKNFHLLCCTSGLFQGEEGRLIVVFVCGTACRPFDASYSINTGRNICCSLHNSCLSPLVAVSVETARTSRRPLETNTVKPLTDFSIQTWPTQWV